MKTPLTPPTRATVLSRLREGQFVCIVMKPGSEMIGSSFTSPHRALVEALGNYEDALTIEGVAVSTGHHFDPELAADVTDFCGNDGAVLFIHVHSNDEKSIRLRRHARGQVLWGIHPTHQREQAIKLADYTPNELKNRQAQGWECEVTQKGNRPLILDHRVKQWAEAACDEADGTSTLSPEAQKALDDALAGRGNGTTIGIPRETFRQLVSELWTLRAQCAAQAEAIDKILVTLNHPHTGKARPQ